MFPKLGLWKECFINPLSIMIVFVDGMLVHVRIFLRMFTFSDFNQDISGWKPAYVEQFEYDGNLVYDADGFPKKIKVRANFLISG